MQQIKGILYAALSSATFGLAPFFTVSLLAFGFNPFEVLSYRWGVATIVLFAVGLIAGASFKLPLRTIPALLALSGCRAVTSLSLVFAYENIASGVASIIHFMYPLAVALGMCFFFGERKSIRIFTAVVLSFVGTLLLSSGDSIDVNGGDTALGLVCACVSIFSYAAYIMGVRKTRAAELDTTALTSYVMALGALIFIIGGFIFHDGIRIETDPTTWLYILGLALPATAISNISLVKAIKLAGPTLTSLLGAMEPLTAMFIGILVFHEPFTALGAVGVVIILASVTTVVIKKQ